MKQKIPMFILISLVVFSLSIVHARPTKTVDVLLSPTQYGTTSKITPVLDNTVPLPDVFPAKRMVSGEGPVTSPLSVDMVLQYDNGSEASSLGGLASGFHLGVWFQSPSACTLLEVYYYFYTGGDVTYYVADPADTIDFVNDYEEYHGGSNPGPSPIETYLHPEVSATAPDGWNTLVVTSEPDVEKNVFFCSYIMDDGASSPIIDAGVDPPYHTLMQRPGGGGGPYGWYSSWHHVYIRALVRMYENPPPIIDAYDQLPNSYVTTGREVTVTAFDLGIPLDSTGLEEMWLFYRIDGGSWDSLAMTVVSGDSSNGVWKQILPALSAGQTMDYYFYCFDYQGLQTTNPTSGAPVSYAIRERTNDVLFVNDDYYGGGFSYDVLALLLPLADRWEVGADGSPDNSVINAGYNVIIWNSWGNSGPSFADAESLMMTYLDGGGNLLVSGMDIPAGEFGYDWGDYTTLPGEYLRDYFGIRGGTDDFASDSISVYFGRTGDAICGVFNEDWPLTSAPYYWAAPVYNYGGRFDEDPDTTQWKGILYDEWGNCAAFKFEQPGIYKVVWFYFPFAYLADYTDVSNPDTLQQQTLITNILEWFIPGPVIDNVTSIYQTTMTSGPYPVSATLVNFADSLEYVNLVVSANGVDTILPMTLVKADTAVYAADIPAFTVQTEIVYYVEAMDADSQINQSDSYEFWYLVPSANVLYVNESGDAVLDYRDALDSLGIPGGGYNAYDPGVQGQPDSTFVAYLSSYPAVVWNGDWGYGTMLTRSSAGNVLYEYMLNGGNIFFNSDEILGLWDGWADTTYVAGDFPYDVLMVDAIFNDVNYDSIYGVTGDPVSDGIVAEMTFPLTNWNDEVGILAAADSIFTDFAGATVRGVKWSDINNKVVFLPFMFNALPKSTQIQILGNALMWFGTKFKYTDKDGIVKPIVFSLSQNTPNPTNGRTTIAYAIPKKTNVTLSIYNAAGRLVRTLVNENQDPGFKRTIWNGQDKNNRTVAQGVYFYRLTAGNFTATNKLLIVR